MAIYVPGKYIVKKYTGPKLSEHSATSQKVWQKAHYALPSGRWTTKPAVAAAATVRAAPARAPARRTTLKLPVKKKTKKKISTRPTAAPGAGVATPPPDEPTYQGESDASIEAHARALAAAGMGDKAAAIRRAQAAAMAQAQRDAATYQALGQAQMGMISQIPAQLQGIRNTAGTAIASYGNQLSQGSAQGLQAQQAAAASFEAGQTGMAPTGPGPAPADGAGPAPTGPGPAAGEALGVNAQATMAASAQMGGVIPATQQAEIGAASANAAAGMPAVVARATQDQVAMRMAQAATEDGDYRQQLIDLAATQGGAYEEALSSLYDIEDKKYGRWAAEQNRKFDVEQFRYKQQQDKLDRIEAHRAFLAAQVAARTKTQAQADKDMRAWMIAQDKSQQGWSRIDIAQQGADTAAAKANKPKAPKGGVAKAASMAASARGTPNRQVMDSGWIKNGKFVPDQTGKAPKVRHTIKNAPKMAYDAAYKQIFAAMKGLGYPDAEAGAIARGAVNRAYGPGVGGRPK